MNGDNGNGGGGPPPVLHFLRALGHAAVAWGELAFNGAEEEQEGQEPARRRRHRRPAQRAEKPYKPCCIAKRKPASEE